ncbi:DUF255 domain-containing protein [Desertibaculum subflavum]|uniref:DUF255 domain-containing protein n=1 Tax=Desertibaculum subflavum TaxID=2268458 RepID=UPI000E65F8B3
MLRRLLLALTAILSLPGAALAADPASPIAWRGWSVEVFEQARREGKLVLLDMEAVWCHWCHVMDETTYRDPKVVELIGRHVIAVKVDQDANPALSQRYEDWGWPATIVFDGQGQELHKERGYIAPADLASTLAALIANPVPLAAPPRREAESTGGQLSPAQLEALTQRFAEAYDDEQGGWGGGHKFVQAEALDWALSRALRGDRAAAERARTTLRNARALIDPVFGGVFQYSDNGRWDSPHFEKIMSLQTQALRLYATAATVLREPALLDGARDIHRFIERFMRAPDGGYYVSQDADLRGARSLPGKDYYALPAAARLAAGLPRIDTSTYARETGWTISAYIALHEATGDPAPLRAALDGAAWAIANRRGADGGFVHGAEEAPRRSLQPNLAMGIALLDLYRSTADRRWLVEAARTADHMIARLEDAAGGFPAAPEPKGAIGALAEPVKHLDDNTMAARFLNLLGHHTGAARHRDAARRTLAWLAAAPAAGRAAFWPGLLQAAHELGSDPLHLTVVGARRDAATGALFAAAKALPGIYRRLELYDPADGDLPNHDVTYPELPEPALFACTNKVCSLPVFDAADVPAAFAKLVRRAG